MTQDYSTRGYKGWDTRRLYLFEVNSEVLKPLQKQIPLRDLIRRGKTIWKSVFHFRLNSFPDMRFGPGTKYNVGMTSYYHWYDHFVEFAPKERNYITLVHELVHAAGREDHDYEFVFQEFKVLNLTFNLKLKSLSDEADKFKLPYQPRIVS